MLFALKLVALAITLVVVSGTIVIAVSYFRFSGEIAADIEKLTASATSRGVVVTDAMINQLPSPAQRYLRYAGAVGRPIPKLVRLTQTGRIRSSATSSWMTLEADETYAIDAPGFVWRAWLPSRFMPVVLGRDAYLVGKGSIAMKMLALVPVADEHGDALGPAGLMRYLNETMWFPSALLGDNVAITAVDDTSFKAVITDRGMSAEAVFFIDSVGRVVNFRARRFNTSTGQLETWETPIDSYGDFNGMKLPATGKAVWRLPEGDLDYIELEIKSVDYEN